MKVGSQRGMTCFTIILSSTGEVFAQDIGFNLVAAPLSVTPEAPFIPSHFAVIVGNGFMAPHGLSVGKRTGRQNISGVRRQRIGVPCCFDSEPRTVPARPAGAHPFHHDSLSM